ncbi:MAG: ABC transporter ATP-binding protein [Dehalococcoidia bacterium]
MNGFAVRHVSHAFRGERVVPVLDDVSLEADEGTFVSLVGPSGCGKSTLLRILAGLLTPETGEAEVGGRDAAGHPGLAAFMPQKDLLLPWRRALANATLGAEIAGVGRRQAREQALALFEPFGLAGFERAWPAQLSGGMRQRLALLRTFLTPGGTLLLDEPFGALDAITRREMQAWLQEVWLRHGRTVLFVTHDVEEALLLSDRVAVMSPRPGRIATMVDAPFARPRHSELVTEPAFVARKAALLAALDDAMRMGEGARPPAGRGASHPLG